MKEDGPLKDFHHQVDSFSTISRKGYLLRQKAAGRAVMGVFPGNYPKEILWALGILPAEIWDPPLEITKASAHLQPYVCSVVRSAMELVVQGKCDFLDGFLFPHTCDSVQNMASVINDYLGPSVPCHFFYLPKAPFSGGAKKYYEKQLRGLAASLERKWGPLKLSRLKGAIELSNQISDQIWRLYKAREKQRLRGRGRDFYEVIRKGEYLAPEDFIIVLRKYLQENTQEESGDQAAVVLSGILSNPLELMDKLDELGVVVAGDDLFNTSRRLLSQAIDASIDPFEALAQRYFRQPPCSTKGSRVKERLDFLTDLVKKTNARGIIFNVVKFCEPEFFDIPFLEKAFKETGIPTLVLETEVNQGLSGQMITRLEAFAELLHSANKQGRLD